MSNIMTQWSTVLRLVMGAQQSMCAAMTVRICHSLIRHQVYCVTYTSASVLCTGVNMSARKVDDLRCFVGGATDFQNCSFQGNLITGADSDDKISSPFTAHWFAFLLSNGAVASLNEVRTCLVVMEPLCISLSNCLGGVRSSSPTIHREVWACSPTKIRLVSVEGQR